MHYDCNGFCIGFRSHQDVEFYKHERTNTSGCIRFSDLIQSRKQFSYKQPHICQDTQQGLKKFELQKMLLKKATNFFVIFKAFEISSMLANKTTFAFWSELLP